jgi:hypothetical protein
LHTILNNALTLVEDISDSWDFKESNITMD